MRKNNKNSFSKSKFIKKRGFTLIELIVVMAVIAILVLLAMPKFMNYAEEARITRIKNDVKVAEDMATEYLVEYDKFPGDWDSISVSELNTIKDENRLYEKKGLATTIQSGEYVAIDKNFVKTKIRSRLKGTFYANLDAKVYYEDSKAGKSNNDDNGGENEGGNNNGDENENGCPTYGMKPISFPDDNEPFIDSDIDSEYCTVGEAKIEMVEEAQFMATTMFLDDSEYTINITYLTDTDTEIEYVMFMLTCITGNFPVGAKHIIMMNSKWIEGESEYDRQINIFFLDKEGEILFFEDIYGLCPTPTHIGIYNDNWELQRCEKLQLGEEDLSNWVFVDIEENMSGGQLLTAKNDNNEYKYVLVNNPVGMAYKDNFKRIKADKLKEKHLDYFIAEEEGIHPEVYTTLNQKPDYIYDACNYIINGELYSYNEKFIDNDNPYKSILFVNDSKYSYFIDNPDLNYNYDIYVQKANGDIELIKVIYDNDGNLYTIIRDRPILTNLLKNIEVKQSCKVAFGKIVIMDTNNNLYFLYFEPDSLHYLEEIDLKNTNLEEIVLSEDEDSEYYFNEIAMEEGIQLKDGITKSFILDEYDGMNHPDIVYYVEDINETLYKINIEIYELIEDESLVDFNEWVLSDGKSFLEKYIGEFIKNEENEINEQIINNAEKILFSEHNIGRRYKAVYILTNDGELYIIGKFILY